MTHLSEPLKPMAGSFCHFVTSQTTCQAFVDPYVEHDSLTLLLDLILLKRGVYRHLLYNRGAEPKLASNGSGVDGAATDANTEDTNTLDKAYEEEKVSI